MMGNSRGKDATFLVYSYVQHYQRADTRLFVKRFAQSPDKQKYALRGSSQNLVLPEAKTVFKNVANHTVELLCGTNYYIA